MNDDLATLVAGRVASARQRIADAGGRDVQIVAVTKRFSAAHGLAAVAAGCAALAENYAQEALLKWTAAPPPVPLQFVGRLQTNKVRQLCALIDVYATIDRPALIEALARRAPRARVMIQVDTTAEPAKGGCPLAEAPALVAAALDAGLRVEGLMTVGPTFGGPQAARPGFRSVRALADRLGLAECSMGMSADLEVGVAEGATQVRLGTALFGQRDMSVG